MSRNNRGKRPFESGPAKPGAGPNAGAASPAEPAAQTPAGPPPAAPAGASLPNPSASSPEPAKPAASVAPGPDSATAPTPSPSDPPAKPGQPAAVAAPAASSQPGTPTSATAKPSAASTSAPSSVAASALPPPGQAGKPASSAASGSGRPLASPTPGALAQGPAGRGDNGSASPPPARRGGFVPGLIGGLIGGGAIAAGAVLWLNQGPGLQPINDRLTELQSQVAAVDAKATAAGELPPEVSGLPAKVGELDSRLQQLGQLPADLEQRVGTLQTDLGNLSKGVQGAIDAGTAARDALASIQIKLPELEGAVAANSAAREQLSTVEQRVAATEQASQQLEPLRRTVEEQLATLNGRLDEAQSKLDFVSGQFQRAAVMMLAVGDIDRALERAEPFEPALASIRALGGEDQAVQDALAQLEPVATSGVPDLATLRAGFNDLAQAVETASVPTEGMLDQAANNLMQLVQVRPVGEAAAGATPTALLARAEAKLGAEDLQGAVDELAALPEPAAAAAGGWLTQARQRLAAEQAAAGLRAYAREVLAKAS